MENADIKLSPSERQTLQYVAEGDLPLSALDWIAVQRLKASGLIEERSAVPALTPEGRRVLQRLTLEALKRRR